MLHRLLVMLLIAAALVIACGGDDEAEPTPTSESTARDNATAGRIAIPSIEVDAPLTPKLWVAGEALPSPDGSRDVAIYDFGTDSGLGGAPGEGGNTVLAGLNLGILDCAPAEPPCNAVFRRLSTVEPGAELDLSWRNQLLHYQVVAMCNVATLQFSDIVYVRTSEEQLTLLTGAGTWNFETGWSHVLIVIAKPAPRTAFEACPPGTSTGRP